MINLSISKTRRPPESVSADEGKKWRLSLGLNLEPAISTFQSARPPYLIIPIVILLEKGKIFQILTLSFLVRSFSLRPRRP